MLSTPPVLIFPRLCLNPAPLYVRFSKEKRSASFRLPTELVKYKILIKYNPKYTESYEMERIEGTEKAAERLDDVLFHKIPYISDYI